MRHKAGLLLSVCALCLLLTATAALALWDQVVWPEASGDVVLEDASLVVDASHASDGYIMARVKDANAKKGYKLRVSPKKDQFMYYDLSSEGDWDVLPLRYGDGQYIVQLFVSAGGKSYTNGGQVKLQVELSSELAPYLAPSQYVDYDQQSAAVALSDQICADLATDMEKYEAVRAYIQANYAYDQDKASKVRSMTGVLPDIDYCVENQMGICQDLAATVACMLRVQGIPTKLVIGRAGGYYHAWNAVYIAGEEIFYDPTEDLIPGAYAGKRTVERVY